MSAAARRFEKACRHWQRELGMTDWTLTFAVGPASSENAARVDYNVETRQAVIYYFLGSKHPARLALHEVLHLALADVLATAARLGSDDHRDVSREEHRLIERLLNALDGVP